MTANPSILVDTSRIPVRDDTGNTVFVRSRMPFGIKTQVQQTEPALRLLRIYQFNILGWSGPMFHGVECTPENIENLDTSRPDVSHMMQLVGQKIEELNPQPQAPKEPGSTSENGSTSSTEAGSLGSEGEPSSADSGQVTSETPHQP
jgi:hypothetical protein